jgi:photosystem II stability/assembly factor-like uncharacterized protein/subtilisin-like proprotein convertase family protein
MRKTRLSIYVFKQKAMKNLICISLMCVIVSTSFSQKAGWQWQNPYLLGNDLNSIFMTGPQGWAVGDEGTLLHTETEWYDYEVVDLGTIENLNCVYMSAVSGRGWIVGNNGAIFFTNDYGETWLKQNSGTHQDLYSVTGIDGECIWVCGDNVILHAFHYGETWEWINSTYHSRFFAVDQKDCQEIWISGEAGLVISTKDAGISWQLHPTPVTYNLYSIDVVPYGDYRACGHQAVIISSSDAGDTWIKENETTFLDLYDVDTKGIVGPAYAVGSKGTILETLNGGSTWAQIESPTINTLNDVCFRKAIYPLVNQVFAVGWYGLILKKEEPEEAEFEIMNERPLHIMQSVDFISADTGWAVGGDKVTLSGTKEGIILHTADGGKTWEKQLTIPDILNCVDFINKTEGWAVGANGIIKHTTNGGYSWKTQTSPLYGQLNAVCFVDENNGWIVSRDNWGEIVHTTDGGSTWIRQTPPTHNALVDVFFINADKGWIVGMDSTILRTTDGGQTWLRCDLVVSNNHFFRSVYFIDELHGWTVGVYGIIMLTNDGGITWQEINSGFSESLFSVCFVDPDNGWATGSDGTILRSIDGGYTWFEQYSGIFRNTMASIHFANLNDGWVCGEGGNIKGTKNGGFWNEPGTFLRNKLDRPINDLTETSDILTVDFSDIKSSGYLLVGLAVMIDSIMHTRAGDLEISLSHSGITETLVSTVSDPGANFLWTKLTDEASKMISNGVAPFSGNHKPFHPLTAFNGLDPGGEWILKIYDGKTGHTGTLNAWGIKPLFEKIVAINEPIPAGEEHKIILSQNVPNPFSGITKIKWISEIGGYTTLKVFNVHGELLTTLKNAYLPKGEYSIEFDGSHLSAGVYYYQLQVGHFLVTKKCIIM